ncbi:hypothetical protein SAY86_026608 [Trapa natans]|uniref:Uncharacterized protein n=1 Tax=Trapa natans TaxID=22666 RepID=A0AAN7KIU1_TRANT|nr:hypothetical protein SAY86_026608 [Trapa natans]
MGNCCPPRPSTMVCARDDWELPAASEKHVERVPPFGKQRLLGHLKKDGSPYSSPSPNPPLLPRGGTPTKVKIKITKMELDELLRKAEAQKLSSQQVLAGIIEASSGCYIVNHHKHQWKPELMSIPEVN